MKLLFVPNSLMPPCNVGSITSWSDIPCMKNPHNKELHGVTDKEVSAAKMGFQGLDLVFSFGFISSQKQIIQHQKCLQTLKIFWDIIPCLMISPEIFWGFFFSCSVLLHVVVAALIVVQYIMFCIENSKIILRHQPGRFQPNSMNNFRPQSSLLWLSSACQVMWNMLCIQRAEFTMACILKRRESD